MMKNKTMIIPIDKENIDSVLSVLAQPILEKVKPNILMKLLEYENGYGTLDSIRDTITTQQLSELLDLGVDVERLWYWLELKPNLATNNTPAMFPKRTIPTEWDEDGNPTATRVLKAREYFYNETHNGRFFIRLAKAPVDSNGCIKSEDLPSSAEVKQIIQTFGANILNHYSPKAWHDFKASLNIEP